MMTRRHTITPFEDYPRLQALVNSRVVRLVGGPDRLDQLQTKLAKAQILPRDEVPSDIVTMNSAVVLRDLATSKIETYTLVFPESADIENHRLSVLAPMGTTILGKPADNEFRGRVGDGWRKVKVEQVLRSQRDDALRSREQEANSQNGWSSWGSDDPAQRKL